VNCICVLCVDDPDRHQELAASTKRTIGPLVASVLSLTSAAGGSTPQGLDELWREIHHLHGRIDATRTARALNALEELSFRDRTLAFLRERVESIRFEPRMHTLGLIAALRRSVSEDVELPPSLLTRLEQLVTGDTTSQRLGVDGADGLELTQAALAELRTWKAFENGSQASPGARRVAEAVSRSLQIIARQAERGESTT
jgi:hypothetical protein